jgi:hypothetical protein
MPETKAPHTKGHVVLQYSDRETCSGRTLEQFVEFNELLPNSPSTGTGQRDRRVYFVIFIFGNFRLTAATTEACSGFPELLAKASRA